ncbi:hypothetical protein evm_011873 [Chilo suppressalis]|nr:hypothetical protein evm_011873 [Chilo suppressalis]
MRVAQDRSEWRAFGEAYVLMAFGARLIGYHLRNTVNFAIRTRAVEILSTRPQEVGPQVVDMLKALAARLLPVAELLDVHLAHSSPAFKDTCPSTWLGIVNNK